MPGTLQQCLRIWNIMFSDLIRSQSFPSLPYIKCSQFCTIFSSHITCESSNMSHFWKYFSPNILFHLSYLSINLLNISGIITLRKALSSISNKYVLNSLGIPCYKSISTRNFHECWGEIVIGKNSTIKKIKYQSPSLTNSRNKCLFNSTFGEEETYI